MKEFLTEWLIRYGTGWVDTDAWYERCMREDFIEWHPELNLWRITPKGLAFLKEPE